MLVSGAQLVVGGGGGLDGEADIGVDALNPRWGDVDDGDADVGRVHHLDEGVDGGGVEACADVGLVGGLAEKDLVGVWVVGGREGRVEEIGADMFFEDDLARDRGRWLFKGWTSRIDNYLLGYESSMCEIGKEKHGDTACPKDTCESRMVIHHHHRRYHSRSCSMKSSTFVTAPFSRRAQSVS